MAQIKCNIERIGDSDQVRCEVPTYEGQPVFVTVPRGKAVFGRGQGYLPVDLVSRDNGAAVVRVPNVVGDSPGELTVPSRLVTLD